MSNLTVVFRNVIVFSSIDVFILILNFTLPYKSNSTNWFSEKFDIEPIISVKLSMSVFRLWE